MQQTRKPKHVPDLRASTYFKLSGLWLRCAGIPSASATSPLTRGNGISGCAATDNSL